MSKQKQTPSGSEAMPNRKPISELQSLQRIVSMMENLSLPERGRIMTFLLSRFETPILPDNEHRE